MFTMLLKSRGGEAVRRPNVVFTMTIDKETKNTPRTIFVKADK